MYLACWIHESISYNYNWGTKTILKIYYFNWQFLNLNNRMKAERIQQLFLSVLRRMTEFWQGLNLTLPEHFKNCLTDKLVLRRSLDHTCTLVPHDSCQV